jgi:hypothetical protein
MTDAKAPRVHRTPPPQGITQWSQEYIDSNNPRRLPA